MTRKRYEKIEKAVFTWVVNKITDPDTKKRMNKVIYKAHHSSDWLRTTKLYSYQAAYELLLENAYKRMLKEGK